MTLTGTNTWIVRASGAEVRRRRSGALDWKTTCGAGRIRAGRGDPAHPRPSRPRRGRGRLADLLGGVDAGQAMLDSPPRPGSGPTGDQLTVRPVIRALATPGHTVTRCVSWSRPTEAVSYRRHDSRPGHHRGAHPDGDLADYLASLDRLAELGSSPGAARARSGALSDCPRRPVLPRPPPGPAGAGARGPAAGAITAGGGGRRRLRGRRPRTVVGGGLSVRAQPDWPRPSAPRRSGIRRPIGGCGRAGPP